MIDVLNLNSLSASTTNDEHVYESYVRRFRSIYPSSSAPTFAYTSGVNDVGGEGGDRITKENVERFRSHFPQFSVLKMAGDLAQVVTVDQLSETVEPMPKGEEVNAKAKITVAISHAPLITALQR